MNYIQRIINNKNLHFQFTVINLLLSSCLGFISVFGIIFKNITYLIYLPISFLFFVSSLLGFIIIAEDSPSERKLTAFFSVETVASLCAILLIPLAIIFTLQ